MLPCVRSRLRLFRLPLIGLLALTLPSTGRAGDAAASDQARWKDGELLAPLPADPDQRAAALAKAIAFGRARDRQQVNAKSVVYASPGGSAPIATPVWAATPGAAIRSSAVDPTTARRLAGLRDRLEQSERRAVGEAPTAPVSEPQTASPPVEIAAPSDVQALVTSFDGIDDTGWNPGSPDIAVGPNHILIATTDRFSIMDKCGTTLATYLFQDYFGLPGSPSVYYTPKVIYDPWTPRWIMLYIGTDIPGYTNSVLYLAVSETADPLGSWYYYNVPTSGLFPGVKDAPAMSVTPDAVYVTYNQFNSVTFAYEGVVMLELIKSDMYAANGVSLFNRKAMTNVHDASLVLSMQPAQMRTYAGDMYFVDDAYLGSNFFTLWKLTGSPGGSILTGFDVAVTAYTFPPDMAQPNATLVDAGDCRIRDAVYASGKLYAAYTHSFGGFSTVETRQVDVVSLANNGVLIGGAEGKAYPAIDIDENDNVTMGYSITGPGRFLSVLYNIFRLPFVNVEAGTIQTGLANFSFGPPPFRWGPYFGAALDPSDGRTIWIHGTYASNSPLNSWTTRVGAATAFARSNLDVSAVSGVYVSGFEGGPFAPSFIDFQLMNTGGAAAVWRLSGVPPWLTPGSAAGALDPGASETIHLFVNATANSLPQGTYPATLTFSNCTGLGGTDWGVELAVGIDGSCPGSRVALAPPIPPTGYQFSPVSQEYGTFVTSIHDVHLCAIGVEVDLGSPQDLTATVYLANGTTRGAILTNATLPVVQEDALTRVYFVPVDVTLEACHEYDIAVTFEASATFPYWDDTMPGLLPGDAGGLIRVRDAEIGGVSASNILPRIVLIADPGTCASATDLDAGAGVDVEITSATAQGLFVSPERTIQLCSLALEADLTLGAAVTARVYGAIGGSRTGLLAQGSTVVTSPAFSFHDVPISQVLLAGSQYDLEVEFAGGGTWRSYNTPPVVLPYSVDNTMQVYGAEAYGVVTSTLPHLRIGWSDFDAGTPFDLGKVGDVNPPPFSSSGSLSHGAYITSLIDQDVYGLGVMADIPDGGYITAYLYEATGTTRGPLMASGVVISDGAGAKWHDVPLSASLVAGGEYDIMFSVPTINSWRYWLDTSGLPYNVYGTVRVRDAESAGVIGTAFLAHMRVRACNPVLTAVGEKPARPLMLLDPPAPNPSSGVVRFGYSTDEAGEVDIAIYDVAGRRVATVAQRRGAAAGRDAVDFDTGKLASGMYFVKLTTKTKATSRKFIVTH